MYSGNDSIGFRRGPLVPDEAQENEAHNAETGKRLCYLAFVVLLVYDE